MKKKNLKLSGLKVQSFVTSLNDEQVNTLKGGNTNTNNPACNTLGLACNTIAHGCQQLSTCAFSTCVCPF